MDALDLTVLIAFLIIAGGYVLFGVVLFYHIGRYSYIGDASKRVFAAYAVVAAAVVALGVLAITINHFIGA